MLKKKYIFILLLLAVSICTLSAVSAADNVSDVVAAGDANDTLSVDEGVADEVATDLEENTIEMTEEVADGENLSAKDEDSALAKDQSDEPLSTVTCSYDLYSIKLDDGYLFSSYATGTIDGTVTPPASYLPDYSFKLYIFDKDDEIVCYSPSFTGRATSFAWKIPAKTLLPGIYDVCAVNDWDTKIMSSSTLAVGGQAVITAKDFNGKYMSSSKMTARITDKVTGKPLTNLVVKAVFTKGKTSKTEYYLPNSNGVISFEPPVGVGTWSVKFSPYVEGLSGSAVKKAIVKKSSVSIKAYKVTEYKGFKTTLKAVVKSHGRKVKEGTVTFKINGKTYKVAVKNGVAIKKVNLKKIKTYKYTAKFNGNKNLAASKKVKSTAKLKKSFKTKIYAKNYYVYVFKEKVAKIIIKTKEGKKVKNGKLKIIMDGKSTVVKVKNGVAKIKLKGLSVVDHFKGFTSKGETYKKFITKKVKLKYVPTSHKYKASTIKIKVSSVFRCTVCGKTTSHYHMGHDSYGVPYKHFIAIV